MPRISTLPCCGVVDIEAEQVVRLTPPTAPTSTSGAPSASGPEPGGGDLRRCGGQTRRAPGRGGIQRAAEICEARMEPPNVDCRFLANGSIRPSLCENLVSAP
jgi:hypothetical protein